ncbi:LysR family transcriptional regulator [Acinetobacter puyangensis]|uniref:LysR family transcriptional regulator n=1 Tax=Acinetobacter puyangensis TaxID=1096779 RepID=UPI003A4DE281
MTIAFSRFSEYFLMVAKNESFRKAADHLHISVSAVHRQIVLAEEELGVQLFERIPNGLKLTLAGELLYADILRWQKDFKQTCTRFDEIQGLKRGSIEFGLITALSEGFIVECIAEINEKFPWINFQIQIHDSERIAAKIVNTEIDFGLILDPLQHSHLDVISFMEIPLGFVVSPEHPLAQRDKIQLSETIDYHHIIADAPLVIHDRVTSIYKRHQFVPQRQTQCNDIRLICSLLQKNFGIAIMCYLDAYTLLQQKKLKFIPIQEKGVQPLTLALCTAPKRQVSRAAQIMMNQIIERMEQLKTSKFI